MKKLLLLFAATCCCATLSYADGDGGGKGKGERTEQDIQVDEARLPIKPMRPRYEAPTHTDGTVNYEKATVEVNMNSYMGELNIAITDQSGMPVYQTAANSDAIASVSMPMPQAGSYRLVITGEEYQAEGAFTIE